MALPTFNTQDRTFSMLQSTWAAAINPLLSNPVSKGVLLTEIPLAIGTNVINHLLSRQQQGWIITDQNAAASIYRSQPLNDKTLTLTSDAVVTVSILVY